MSKQGVALLIFLGLFCQVTLSQTFRYTAGVTEAGIYKISADQAKKLGFTRLEEVAIYGYALSGALGKAELSQVANAVYAQLQP